MKTMKDKLYLGFGGCHLTIQKYAHRHDVETITRFMQHLLDQWDDEFFKEDEK